MPRISPLFGRKRYVLELEHPVAAAHGQPLHAQARLRVHRVRPGDVERDLAADHHVGHLLRVRLARNEVAHELAVPQHDHAVGQLLHLVELVRDEHDGLARVAHVAQHGKELLRLLQRQHGGRLVEDQDVRAAVEHLDDLDRLLLRDGHVVDLLVRVHLKAVGVADLPDARGDGLEVQHLPARQAEDDVLRRGQHVHELEVLVDHADAQVERVLRAADGDRTAVHLDLALVREIDAREHVHERGLAAAVLAQQGQDLAPVDVQIDLLVGRDAAEGLGDAAHAHRWDLRFQWLPSSIQGSGRGLRRTGRRRGARAAAPPPPAKAGMGGKPRPQGRGFRLAWISTPRRAA